MIGYGYPITLNETGVSVLSNVSNSSVLKFWDIKDLEHECAVSVYCKSFTFNNP